MGASLFSRVTDLDHGFLLTLRRMTVAPGATIREYVAGRRRRYLNPLSYLTIAVALSFLIWTYLGHDLMAATKDMVARSFETFAFLSPEQRRRAAELQVDLIVPYQAQISVLICVPLVLLLRLFFRRSGYNLAEHLVFALFATAQVFFVDNLVMLALIAGKSPVAWHTVSTYLIYAGIFVQAALGFYRRGLATAIKMLAALTVSFYVFSAAAVTAVVVYVRLTGGR
jgi:hypothetical protein